MKREPLGSGRNSQETQLQRVLKKDLVKVSQNGGLPDNKKNGGLSSINSGKGAIYNHVEEEKEKGES